MKPGHHKIEDELEHAYIDRYTKHSNDDNYFVTIAYEDGKHKNFPTVSPELMDHLLKDFPNSNPDMFKKKGEE